MKQPLALALALLACGGKPPPDARPAPLPEASASAAPSASDDGFVEQGVTAWGLETTESKTPPSCTECTSVSGSLVPGVIQRIIHLNRARMRACYADAVRKTPSLTGRVAVHFVIGRSGAVSKAEIDPSSTLADADLGACLVTAFKALSFPQPEGGEVGVTYPMVFTP